MIKAALFDVYGTCVDWRSGVAAYVTAMFADKGLDRATAFRFADLWRAKYDTSMEKVRSGAREYVPLDVLQRENLDAVLAELDLEDRFSNSERDQLNNAWDQLPAWPDTVEQLTRLGSVMQIAACSNGSIAMMGRLAIHAGLPWSMICGADRARTYKREAAVYLQACRALGVAPDETIMIACHVDDLDAAQMTGLKTGYFPRPLEHGEGNYKPVANPGRFTFQAETMMSLVDQLVGATRQIPLHK